jgi:hypothetical protein
MDENYITKMLIFKTDGSVEIFMGDEPMESRFVVQNGTITITISAEGIEEIKDRIPQAGW